MIVDDYKRLILAFVESQIANKDKFDDIIEGKGMIASRDKPLIGSSLTFITLGRGLIILLEGSPGVGKTLTGEAGETGR